DLRALASDCRRDMIGAYAAYHARHRTPGKVYRIPGRRCRMWLPISSGEAVAQRRFGAFEPETFRTLDDIVQPGATVVEIGACYGEFTIHLSRLVTSSGRVYSFEMFPSYFEIAQRNVALNKLTNVELMN